MRRAILSVCANIAEGYSKTPNDFKRYLASAIGSCDELVSHLNDARNIGLLNETIHKLLIADYGIVGKQLTRLKQQWK